MKFIVYKEELSVEPDSIKNADVKYLLDLDTSKRKETATKAILYVFFCKDLSDDNPLNQLPYHEKETECLLRAFGDEDYDIEMELGIDWYEAILTASESYYNHNVDDTLKDIDTFNRKMDELGSMLNITKPSIKRNVHETTQKISFSTNTGIINKALASIVSIIQSKASLVSIHVQGTVPKNLRGGLSPLSKGKIKIKT